MGSGKEWGRSYWRRGGGHPWSFWLLLSLWVWWCQQFWSFLVVRWENSWIYCWRVLQVHDWLNGKKTLRQLPWLKIHCSRGGDLSDFLLGFFETGGKNFKDIWLTHSWSFKQIDIFIEGRVRGRDKGIPLGLRVVLAWGSWIGGVKWQKWGRSLLGCCLRHRMIDQSMVSWDYSWWRG